MMAGIRFAQGLTEPWPEAVALFGQQRKDVNLNEVAQLLPLGWAGDRVADRERVESWNVAITKAST